MWIVEVESNCHSIKRASVFSYELLSGRLSPVSSDTSLWHWVEINSLVQKCPGECAGYTGTALVGWWRGSVVRTSVLAGELSLSCARPAADG